MQDVITFSPRYKKGDLSTTWLSDLIFSLGWCENNTMLKISQEQEQYLASNNDQCQHLSFVSVSSAHISVHRTFHCSALLSTWPHLTRPLSLTTLDSYNTAAYSEMIKNCTWVWKWTVTASGRVRLHLLRCVMETQEMALSETEKLKCIKHATETCLNYTSEKSVSTGWTEDRGHIIGIKFKAQLPGSWEQKHA